MLTYLYLYWLLSRIKSETQTDRVLNVQVDSDQHFIMPECSGVSGSGHDKTLTSINENEAFMEAL